ncbi:MAG: UvrD-helicase domain-containing protein [Proteobacteria bacterium]|nr:UvrD-helicase domain-containing protein [Pseudomonadota bacterium]
MSDEFAPLETPQSNGPLPYLAGLNQAQIHAVEAQDGPVLVLAGAGTGKTRVLTARLAHLLASGRARPWNILAVTFTNKAAREMKQRVAAMIGPAVEQVWLGTFHALCTRILRRHAELAGLRSNFTILDSDDQIRLLKQLIAAHNIDDKRWPARVVLGVIQRWKDKALTPDRVPTEEAGEIAGGRAVALYRAYQERLRTLNAADFGDLILHTVTLFQTQVEVLRSYQQQFRYILVDEYQDTNVAQYLWLRLLAQGHRNLCCVGDEDQSIYGWRGAEIGNILRFEHDFPGARVIRLEQNYRSTPHILAAAAGLIAHNQSRLGKTLWTASNEGEKVRVQGVWDGEEEARAVGEEIEALQRRGERLAEMAILVRAGFQTREFEERFISLGLAYKVIGGLRFYERQEIRDALAYLRVVAQPDDDLAFERIVNVPKRGIGDASLSALHKTARAQGVSLTRATRALIATDELKPQARRTLAALIQDFDRWRKLAEGMPGPELAGIVLDESGYTGMWQADKSIEAPGRLENLKEFVRAIEAFDSLTGFLEHVALVVENAEAVDGDQVSMMTMHSAKGLEFDTVFLPGWEEGLFPHPRSLDENGEKGLEEERRLAYVGLTRARHRALISHAANRRVHNLWQSSIPSRFVGEMPAASLDYLSEPGLYSGAGHGLFGLGEEAWGARAGSGIAVASGRQNWGRHYGAAPLIEADARVFGSESAKPSYAAGMRVFHQKFGYGTVETVTGDKLEVAFDHAGRKKVIDSFVAKA